MRELGSVKFVVCRQGGPWEAVPTTRVRDAVFGEMTILGIVPSEASVGDFSTCLRLTSCDPRCYRGEFDTEAEAVVRAKQLQDAFEAQKLIDSARRAERVEQSRRNDDIHDRLYGQAMHVAAGDCDDMDCVEHYCQGHIGRLRQFILARNESPCA